MGRPSGTTSVEIPSTAATKGETLPRKCPWMVDTPIELADGATSLYCLFERGCRLNPSGPCHGYRRVDPATGEAGPFQWVDYNATKANVLALGNVFACKFGISQSDKIGVMGKNCIGWATVQLAASSQGIVLVPLYESFGVDTLEFVINHSEIALVCVALESADVVVQLRKQGKLPKLRHVIVFGSETVDTPAVRDYPPVRDGAVYSLGELIACRKEASGSANPARTGYLDDLFIIMYTSGTTGPPKGVKLLNRALVAATVKAHKYLERYGFPLTRNDSVLSFLPLAHIYAQQLEANFYFCGARVGYYQGNPKKLLNDVAELNPTFFVAPPRVYQRIQQKIEEAVEEMTRLTRFLFEMAYRSALRAEENLHRRNPLWDVLVLNKIRNKILPRVRIMVTGSAPLSPQTNDYLKVCLNTPLIQGYGLTESTGGITVSPPGRSVSGHCGGPLPGCLVKLRDVPEMEYLTTDMPHPRGEVMLKGDNVFVGYYKNDDETARALDEDGWFATGDIGQFLEDGSLQIIDRRKNLFKLSQGEYVSPEKLENEYVKCKLIGQIWVHGNTSESFLVAVIVPDVEAAAAWALGNGRGESDLAQVVRSKEFKAAVSGQLESIRTRCGFHGYEAVRDFVFETAINDLGQGFTMENGLLTPTLKLKRPQLVKRYHEELSALYRGR